MTPSSSPAPLPGGYLPEIDGLRAVAVLAVVAFHADLLVGGYFGVDLFFVVSGYLITSLLLREQHRTGRIDLRTFWSRRVKRLLPAALATLTATVGLVSVVGEPAEAQSTAKTALASVFSLANWQLILNDRSYWNRFGPTPPLTHFWSLAIEEQFYIAWPLILLVLCAVMKIRRNPPTSMGLSRWVGAVAALLALVSWNVPQNLNLHGQIDRIYLGTDTRAASLFLGCAAAGFGLKRRKERFHVRSIAAADLCALVVVGVLGWMYWSVPYTDDWLYPTGFAAEGLLVVALLVCVLTDGSRVSAIVGHPWLAAIGRYSYTLYLVHLPVFWLLRSVDHQITSTRLFVVGLGLSAVLAVSLSMVVEQRFRRMTFTLHQGVATGGGALAACLATVIVALQLAPVSVTSAAEVPGQLAMTDEGDVTPVRASDIGPLPKVVVLGDSVAGNIADGLTRIAAGQFSVIDQHRDGCGLLDSTRQKAGYGPNRAKTPIVMPGYCTSWPVDLEATVSAAKPVAVVWHLRGDINESEVDGEWISPCDAAFRPRFAARFAILVDRAKPSATRPLIVVAPLVDQVEERAGRCLRNVLADTAANHRFVKTVDLQEQYCPVYRCGGNIDGVERFVDAVHLSVASRLDVARNVLALIPLGAGAVAAPALEPDIDPTITTPSTGLGGPVATVVRLPLLPLMLSMLRSGECTASDAGPLLTAGLIDAVRCTYDGVQMVAARYSTDLDAHRATMRWLQTNLDSGWVELTPDGTLSRTQKLKNGVVTGSVRDDGMVVIVAPDGADEELVRAVQKLLDPSLRPAVG